VDFGGPFFMQKENADRWMRPFRRDDSGELWRREVAEEGEDGFTLCQT